MHRNALRLLALAVAAALAGCTEAPPSPRGVGGADGARVFATFRGEGDLARGTLTITEVTPGITAALVAVPDARPGTRRPDTVELITAPATVGEVDGGCGTVSSFEGEITLRSYFAGATLQNAWVELTSMAPSGYEACNSDSPAFGLDATNGLWSYGSLGAAGGGTDQAARRWKFKLPSNTTNFTFFGRVMADGSPTHCAGLVGLPGPPGTVLPAISYYVPRIAAAGDLNGDGRLDVIVSYSTTTTAAVLLGKGDGTFLPATTLTLGGAPVLADVNQDGILDVVTGGLVARTISFYAGIGDGTFAAPVSVSTGTRDLGSYAVGDVTGDAYPEIVVGLYNSYAIGIIPNNGGVLGTMTTMATTGYSSPIVLADLDGNGRNDLAYVTNDASTGYADFLRVRLNDGAGGFPGQAQYAIPAAGNYASGLEAADMNGDGRPELILANGYQATSSDPSLVALYPNDGAGGFGTPASYAVAGGARSLAVRDLSGDGKPDVAVAVWDLGGASVLLNDGAGGLMPEVRYPGVVYSASALAGDFTSDGLADLLVLSDNSRLTKLLPNLGGGTFATSASTPTSPSPDSSPVAVATADLDGDWNADAIVIDYDYTAPYYAIGVHFGRGDGTLGTPTYYPLTSPGAALATGDVDLDGHPDVVVSNGERISVFRGSVGGLLTGPVSYVVAAGDVTADVALADLNGDGWLDVVVADSSRAQFAVFLNRKDGTFPASPTLYNPYGAIPTKVAVADFSHDGFPDVVVSTTSATLARFRNAGDGTLVAVGNIALGRTPLDLAAGDFDADGWPDLAIADYGPQRALGILPNARVAGTVSFGAGVAYVDSNFNLTRLATGDLDGDGALDVVASTTSGVAGVYLNAGGGAFLPLAPYPVTLPSAADVAIADLDRDFRPDVVLVEARSVYTVNRLFTALTSCLP